MDYAESKEIIRQTSILSEEDTAFIDQHIGEIQDNWGKRQIFRTETEMRISVLQDLKFPTPASKYWQCVREQSVFYEQLVQLSFEYRRSLIKKARLEEAIDAAEGWDKEELQIDMEELQFGMLNMEQAAHDRMRELRLWHKIMQEQIEADPNFDSEDVNAHQLVSYYQRFQNQVAHMGENAAPGERNNMLGQLISADRVLKERAPAVGNVTNLQVRFEDLNAVPRK